MARTCLKPSSPPPFRGLLRSKAAGFLVWPPHFAANERIVGLTAAHGTPAFPRPLSDQVFSCAFGEGGASFACVRPTYLDFAANRRPGFFAPTPLLSGEAPGFPGLLRQKRWDARTEVGWTCQNGVSKLRDTQRGRPAIRSAPPQGPLCRKRVPTTPRECWRREAARVPRLSLPWWRPPSQAPRPSRDDRGQPAALHGRSRRVRTSPRIPAWA